MSFLLFSITGNVIANEKPIDESLLATHITEEELSELFRRIVVSETGLEHSTLLDVVELTGLSVETLQRILNDIRSVGQTEKLAEHEGRLRAVENEIRTHKSIYGKFMRNGTFLVIASDEEHAARYRNFLEIEDEGPNREGRITAIMALGFMLALSIVVFFMAATR